MNALIVAVVLAAHPNLFEPKEMSSEDIFASVAICMDKVMNNGTSSTAAVPMCGCVMDAVRLNTKAGKRPPENNATSEQLEKCHAEQTGQQPKKPGKVGI